MASDNTAPQPVTETKQKSGQEAKKAGDEAGKSIRETKQNSEQVAKKAGDEAGNSVEETEAGDEVGKSIKKILEIVENLNTLSLPAEKTMGRSITVPTKHSPTVAPEKKKSDHTGKNQGESETSMQKLKRNLRLVKDDVRTRFPTGPTPPAEKTVAIARSNTVPAIPTSQTAVLQTETLIPKLQRNLRLLKDDVRKLQDLNREVAEEVGRQIHPLENLLNQVKSGSTNKKLTEGNKKDLDKVDKKIFNLLCQVPLLPNKRNKNKGLDSEEGLKDNHMKPIVCLPGLHANEEDLKRLAVFKDVEAKFEKLGDLEKIYLLSFAVFPENQEVNRTMLMYWWIGEGILILPPPPKKGSVLADEEKPENVVKKILKEFTENKLIEPVENKRKVEPSCYKMTPFVHSSVVRISMEMKLFDIYQKGKKPAMKRSELNKVCLVEGSSSQPEAKAINIKRLSNHSDAEAEKVKEAHLIETVFNVSERFPDFTFKWFSEDQSSTKKKLNPLSKTTYRRLKVFYLGRWERTAKRHIEVENPELMKYLKHMTKLKLLSFQGISRIERLDDAVCKLRDLIILDLRACYNLEKLPDKIDSLKALTYLDITDCYMIDRMPKRLSWLDNLEVLKGFVVSDATDEETVCTLFELENLENLRKLSISINKDVEVLKLFRDIENFKRLEKLKMAWGGINKGDINKGGINKGEINKGGNKGGINMGDINKGGNNNDHKKEEGGVQKFIRTVTMKELPKKKDPPRLPEKLTKLDLQCFPDEVLPSWLQPDTLGDLEKLYIKGGTKLTGFEKKPTKCKVTVLRLKFLPRLKVEWTDLMELFPKLEFLDKYQCPQVSFCPTDGIGIWRKKIKSEQL